LRGKDGNFLGFLLLARSRSTSFSGGKTNSTTTEKPSSTPDAALAAARKLVLGGNDSEEKWRELDEKFNEYPDLRTFKGIGEAGADPGLFTRAVIAAVESVVGPVDEAKQVSVRDSSGGKYVSVTVGPVTVNSGDEVVQIYAAMRETAGNMLKFYL
jgi:putative lipoic acid-binding regulatory protein